MTRRKTVFVVGAGASADFGFPVGRNIANEIQSRLDLEFNENGGVGPHPTPISFALGTSRSDENYIKAARILRAGIGVGETIDQFLMRRKNNPYVRNLGLMTLAHVILDSERKSQLNSFDPDDFERDVNALRITASSWPAVLMEHLIGLRAPEDIDETVFEDIAFIVFNYDRCIQQSLFHRLRAQHDIAPQVALNILHSIPFIHVYGTLGEFDGSVPFGAERAPLVDISKTLRTYHDGVVDAAHAEKIHALIDDAEKIVFLGFGFHEENTKLLLGSDMPSARMFGTAKECPPVPPFTRIRDAAGSEFFDGNCTSFFWNVGFRLMDQPWDI